MKLGVMLLTVSMEIDNRPYLQLLKVTHAVVVSGYVGCCSLSKRITGFCIAPTSVLLP